jgi:tetratricopeptide (TPR) repeat protein
MRRARPHTAIPLLLAAAVALSSAGDVVAQPTPPPAAAAAEAEALRLYNANRLLTARTKAEEALRLNPDSIAANYVVGAVLREAEGSPARALSHLARARELYESRYTQPRQPGAPWQLHRDILFALQGVAGEIEEFEYQLQVQEFYDYLYDPDLLAEHAWPLIHLRRYREARTWAQRAIASRDRWQGSAGRNALCAVEGAARQRQAQFEACRDALQNAQRAAAGNATGANAQQVAVHAYNAALGALAVMRPDEAERMAVEGTRRLEFTTANPWRLLGRLYLDQGRAAQAVDALREMQRWRVRQPANLRDQDRAETDVAVATTLLVAGEAQAGLRFVDRAIERPDRRGLVASDEEQALGAHALLRRALQRLHAELEAERGSWSNTTGRVDGAVSGALARVAAWPDDERIANVLSDEDRLDSTLRMYVRGGIEPVPVWLLGDLVTVLGPGVTAVALREARADERTFPGSRPLHDALDAEVRLAQGDLEGALSIARRSLDALPNTEALLQARVALVGARAARELGNETVMLGLYERAMQRDPGALRRMGEALPAVIAAGSGGGATGEEILTRMRRSPRLREAPRGFRVTVTANDRAARVCVNSPLGNQLGCTDVTRERNEAEDHFAARVVEQFHRETFAMRLGLSTQDLRSLDGTTVANDAAAREQMNNVLRDIAGPEGAPPR